MKNKPAVGLQYTP